MNVVNATEITHNLFIYLFDHTCLGCGMRIRQSTLEHSRSSSLTGD